MRKRCQTSEIPRYALLCSLVLAVLGWAGSVDTASATHRGDPNTNAQQPSYGINAWKETLDASELSDVHSAGFGYYRVAFDQRWVSGDLVKDYSVINAIVEKAARARVALLPTLRKTTSSGAYDPITSEQERSDFVQFAEQMALRYGPAGSFWASNPDLPQFPIQVWEVWNEPNAGSYWGGSPNAHQYGLLLEATRKWMRLASPGVRVLSGGLAQRAGDWRAFMDGVMNAVKTVPGHSTGKCGFDGVSIHPYGRIVSDDSGGASTEPQAIVSDWRSYLTSRSVPSTVPLWITEVGWSSGGESGNSGGAGSGAAGTPSRQEASLRIFLDFVAQYRSSYNIGPMFYFAHRDERSVTSTTQETTQDWHLRTGLVNYAGTRLPAWNTYSARAVGAPYLATFPQRPLTC